jgi:hypothetical protein
MPALAVATNLMMAVRPVVAAALTISTVGADQVDWLAAWWENFSDEGKNSAKMDGGPNVP